MKNSEAKIKKEIILLGLYSVISCVLFLYVLSLSNYLLALVLFIVLLMALGNIKGRINLQINFVHFRKFSFDETSGQFEVAKPVHFFSDYKQHGVLLLHGFSASPQEFRFLIPLLKEKSISFYAPRLTGFGILDLTTLKNVQSIHWLNDALEAFDLLRKHVDEVSVVGHSMGGLLAVLVAQRRDVKQLLLSAPYLVENENHSFRKKILKISIVFFVMRLFLPVVKKSTFDEESDRFVYHAVPINSIKALWNLHSFLNFTNLKNRIYLFSGKLDNTSCTRSNENLLSGENVSFQKYEFDKSGHNILEGTEKEAVANKIIEILTT